MSLMNFIERTSGRLAGFIVSVFLLLMGVILAATVLGSLNVRTEAFAKEAEIRPLASPFFELVRTSDGPFAVDCSQIRSETEPDRGVSGLWVSAQAPNWAQLRCRIRDGSETDRTMRIISEIYFGEERRNLALGFRKCRATSHFQMLSRVWPHARIGADVLEQGSFPSYEDVNLTSAEREDRADEIGSISPFCVFGREVTTNLSFTLESPSVQAVVGNSLNQAMTIIDRDISAASLARVAAVVVSVLDENSGVFKVRRMVDPESRSARNGFRLLMSGTFEFVILSLGFVALIGSVLAVIVVQHAQSLGMSIGRLSVRLGGLLTYLGLLGTLFGVFGAVQALSMIEFLNEYRKAFEQTASFGSMSLAVGTSVVGLGAAVIVGLLQSFLVSLVNEDPFQD